MPWGETATRPATPNGKGERKRALAALGKQDISADYLIPIDPAIEIIGESSDCLIADVTDSAIRYQTGDAINFRLKYNGLVSAMASPYIKKIVI